MSGAVVLNTPIMTREQVDAELTSLAGTVDSISASLLDLENHPGHQLLRSYPQTGQTEREWATVRESIAGLWEDFARYKTVADQARALRARHGRPDQQDLAELTELLHGEPVELGSLSVPLSHRSLTGPSMISTRIGLAGLAARMNQAFERAGALVTRVDTVSSAVRQGLEPIQLGLSLARQQLQPAGADPAGDDAADPEITALRALDDRVMALTERSVSDALSVTDPEREMSILAAALAAEQERVRSQAELRRAWPDRIAELRELAVRIGSVQQRARVARQTVAETIRTSPLPSATDQLPGVNQRIQALPATSGWQARASALSDAFRVANAAMAAAVADEQLATGLLLRRAELKGRLTAYRSKAIRLGRADRPDAVAQYERAASILSTTPCDLAAATTAVAGYQEVVLGRPDRTPGRTS